MNLKIQKACDIKVKEREKHWKYDSCIAVISSPFSENNLGFIIQGHV